MYEKLVNRLKNCTSDTVEDCAGCPYQSGYKGTYCMNGLIEEAADAIEELSKPHWIPVTERLPEPGWYLVRCNEVHKHIHRIAYYYNYYNPAWYEDSNNITEFVTHWMPLPETPKEE